MINIAMFVATGFEDTELVSCINVFQRNNINYELVSVENLDLIKGQNNTLIKSTQKIKDFNESKFDGIVLPGGKGHLILEANTIVKKSIISFNKNQKLIAAICAAPKILLDNNIIENKKFTSHPGFAQAKNNTGKSIEIDSNIITGRDYVATIEFANAIVTHFK